MSNSPMHKAALMNSAIKLQKTTKDESPTNSGNKNVSFG